MVTEQLDQMWIPVIRSWRLNERHYGALQGLNKAETAAKYGEEQVKIWRRSYDVPPPALDADRPALPRQRPALRRPHARGLPLTECLKDTVARFLPFWHDAIAPASSPASASSSPPTATACAPWSSTSTTSREADIVELNIPTGMPLVYELDADLKPIKHYYLGDPEKVKAAMEAVANQGKKQT